MDRVGAIGLELGAVGVIETGHIAGKFDGGHLHTEADTQVRDLVFARKTGGAKYCLQCRASKTTGYQHSVEFGQARDAVWGNRLGVDVFDFDLGMVFHASVAQCLIERLVAV